MSITKIICDQPDCSREAEEGWTCFKCQIAILQENLKTEEANKISQSQRAEQAEAKIEVLTLTLKQIASNDRRSHFNRVDAITLSQWAREAIKEVK